MTKEGPVKTAHTVFNVIEAILELEGARFTELVDHLGMAQSTLHDHLKTLESMGMLVRDGNEYRVGIRFLEYGEQTRQQRQLYEVGRPQVKELAEETGEHASLMIEENGDGVLLCIEKGDVAVNLGAYAGIRVPLTSNAPGKAILAHLNEERIDEIIVEHGLPQLTSKSITDRSELDNELMNIRERGYAIDSGELVEGVKAISAPIVSRGEIQGAVTIGGPVKRMSGERFDKILPDLLLKASNIIELNISHR
ncbi:IclR family transcriptional regulator [Haladaptatus sp. DFWS20]|uniref:IclR family transcriptional regulator n=1 Tax=Haladaptatus sp. DFWS20 TaxID=3403467 RepID=UPI003EB775AD